MRQGISCVECVRATTTESYGIGYLEVHWFRLETQRAQAGVDDQALLVPEGPSATSSARDCVSSAGDWWRVQMPERKIVMGRSSS